MKGIALMAAANAAALAAIDYGPAETRMSKLVSTQFRLFHLDGQTETMEFTAPTVEDAVQAMANRWLAKGTPLRQIVAADGREFNISNEGIPDAVPEG